MAEPGTTLETTLDKTLETGGRAVLETGAARFSARKAATKDGKDCWNAWATGTAISLEREFEVPEATDETPPESPEDGGADVEGVENKSAERLLNVGRVVGILRKLETTDETSQHTGTTGSNVRRQQTASKLSTKNTKRFREKTPKNWDEQWRTKSRNMEKKTLKNSKKLRTPQPLHTVKLRPHARRTHKSNDRPLARRARKTARPRPVW